MRFLVTRPQPECRRTADQIRAAGHIADEAPLLEFRAEAPAQLDLEAVSALVFTSGRALEALAGHRQPDQLFELPVFTVGDRTAAACRQAGFKSVSSANGDAAALARLVAANRHVVEGGKVLYPAARDRSADFEALLDERGIKCETVVVYRMEAVAALAGDVRKTVCEGGYDGILVYSRRTAETLLQLLRSGCSDPIFSRLCVYAISQQAAEPLSGYMSVEAADAPSEKALMELVLGAC
ncbi:uroporphyrinogen-III synthase [Roseibium sp. MMSF_3412]|uniref:uroporphyrinogen-III synthase n=1 Tax=Roseibium sp. MMSF_3412 TaxID=3046712 RepID=UPI00273F7A54|nr:uroporphyrinogen-III synthase [Roseibium sp. MMSF_3412]